jgi:hypothetical protein
VAAAGIDAWRTERRLNRRFLLGVSLLAAVLVIGLAASSPIATALASLRDSATETAALSTVRAALGIELGSVLLLSGGLLLVRKRAAHGLPLGIVLALGAQVVGQNFRAYETADGRVFSRPPELIERVVATTPSASVPRVKHTLPVMNVQGFDSLPGPVRAERLADSLTKNIAIAFGVGYAQAYVSSGEGEKLQLWQEAAPWQRQLLDAYAVSHVVVAKEVSLGTGDGFEKIAVLDSVGAVAFRNQRALPFAYVVDDVVPVGSVRAALAALRSPLVSGGATAAVEGLAGPGPSRPPRRREADACRLVERPSDDVVLDCQLAQAGWVVVNASHHPNWSARAGEHLLPIWRANAMVMAVQLPAGVHRLELSYREPSLPIGLAAAVVLALLGLLIVVRKRRRGSAAVPANSDG